jgi:putative ABC transport system permease protein
MFKLILNKMRHNKLLSLFLIGSAILFTSLLGSIPLFTDGILQRLLVKDLEEFQKTRYSYPGKLTLRWQGFDREEPLTGQFAFYEDQINNQFIPRLDVPISEQNTSFTLSFFSGIPDKLTREEIYRVFKLKTISNWEDHIDIIQGRIPDNSAGGSVIEVMVTSLCYEEKDLFLNEIYHMEDYKERRQDFSIKVVGVFEPLRTEGDLFWYMPDRELEDSAFLGYEDFKKYFFSRESKIVSEVAWYYALDYRELKARRLDSFLERYDNYNLMGRSRGIQVKMDSTKVLEEYAQRAHHLILILWFLYIPILMLLCFLIYMVSRLIMDDEQSSIAVMMSRGASKKQIFHIYLLESVMIGGIALVTGPWLGYFFCSIIGASNGFLEFVQRTSLPLEISWGVWLYTLVGSIFFMITMLLPLLTSSSLSIVLVKRRQGRKSSEKPLWKRVYFDLILIGLALYSYYVYQTRSRILELTGAEGSTLPMDPLLFAASTIFILGLGLVVIRFFPPIMHGIFRMGQKNWSPVLYGALVQVARSKGKEQFLMLFLIFSLALGIFNSTSVRTLNRNMEERIRYSNGADMVLTPSWGQMDEGGGFSQDSAMAAAGGGGGLGSEKIEVQPPPFEPYTKIPGVEHVTPVLKIDRVGASLPENKNTAVELMAVIPNEFGQSAWFRSSLLPFHWYHFLNAIAENPRGCLISQSIQEEYDVNPGDGITLSWSQQAPIPFTVYGVVEYWPGYIPSQASSVKKNHLVVANQNYVFSQAAVEPYEIWINRDKDTPTQIMYDHISEASLPVDKVIDTRQELIKQKNDPLLQGVNGVFSLGFIICMVICLAGFFIYWLFSLKERTLMLGIFRAMGLTKIR